MRPPQDHLRYITYLLGVLRVNGRWDEDRLLQSELVYSVFDDARYERDDASLNQVNIMATSTLRQLRITISIGPQNAI